MTAAKSPLLRPLVLSVALAVAGLGAGSWYGVATAQSTVQAPAPELVAGLPDFTRLVDQVGPAVVSVQAEIGIMAVLLQGPAADVQQAIEFVRSRGVTVEPIEKSVVEG